MKIVRNRADAVGLILLATVVIAGAALALTGHEAGLVVLLITAGVGLGMAFVYFATQSRRTRKPVALLVVFGILAFLFVPFVGKWLGVEWLVYPSRVSRSPSGMLLFGLFVGALQAAFSRLMDRGSWAGD